MSQYLRINEQFYGKTTVNWKVAIESMGVVKKSERFALPSPYEHIEVSLRFYVTTSTAARSTSSLNILNSSHSSSTLTNNSYLLYIDHNKIQLPTDLNYELFIMRDEKIIHKIDMETVGNITGLVQVRPLDDVLTSNVLHARLVMSLNFDLTEQKEQQLRRMLSSTLDSMFDTSNEDLVKLVVENRPIRASKKVLAENSSTFRVMFEANLEESLTNEVIIDDIGFDAMRAFVRFLYTGLVEFDSYDIAKEVFYAADKYEVTSARVEAERYIAACIERDTVIDALVTGDRHASPTIVDASLKVICSDQSQIDSLPGFTELDDVGLLKKIVSFMSKKH